MNKLLVSFLICYFALTPVMATGQQRKAARAAVPPLKEIVKEAFTKELDMGKPRTVRIEAAYKALTESNILELIDTKTRPDTIYISFALSADGDLPGASASHSGRDIYSSCYMPLNVYEDLRKRLEKYDLEWYYTNSYFVENSTKFGASKSELYLIVCSWDVEAFKNYEKKHYKKVCDAQSETFLRIIRTRDGYSYDTLTCRYNPGVNY